MTDDTTGKLIRMANQIGAYFAAYPEEEATANIADHINRFWTRTMRADFLSVAKAGHTDLLPIVIKTLGNIRG
jgi:formate dehydrogenase subunit delta